MVGERCPFEVALEPEAFDVRPDGRRTQLVTLRLHGPDGPVGIVHVRPAEARDLAVRLLEVAHLARVRDRRGRQVERAGSQRSVELRGERGGRGRDGGS